jgi:hypothetical protein
MPAANRIAPVAPEFEACICDDAATQRISHRAAVATAAIALVAVARAGELTWGSAGKGAPRAVGGSFGDGGNQPAANHLPLKT